MRITMIAALDEERGIGKDGAIPWHIPGDQPRFKALTMGHPIIMGRKTYESIGRPLPGRTNIVISRNPDFLAPGCVVVQSLDEALEKAEQEDSQAFIIGGTAIYELAAPKADVLELTEVSGTHGADTFFPEYSADDFEEVARETHDDYDPAYAFVTLHRKPRAG